MHHKTALALIASAVLICCSHALAAQLTAEYVALSKQAQAHEEFGDIGTALGHYAHALTLASEAGDRTAVAGLYFMIGDMSESGGQLQQGLYLYERALIALGLQGNGATDVTEVLNQLSTGGGKIYPGDSQASVSVDLFRGTISDLGSLLANPNADRHVAILACINAGNLYLAQSQFDQAEILYRKGLETLTDSDSELSLQVRTNLVWTAIKGGDLDEADSRLKLVLEKAGVNRAGKPLRRSMVALGVNRREQGRTEEALQLLEDAVELHRQASDDLGTARALAHLGSTHFTGGNPEQAKSRYSAALKLNRRLNDREVHLHATGGLAKVYKSLGDPEAALVAYAEYVDQIHRLGATLATDQGRVSFLQDYSAVFGEYAAIAVDLARQKGDWASARAAIETIRSRSLRDLRDYRSGEGRRPAGTMVWQARAPFFRTREDPMWSSPVQSSPGLLTQASPGLGTKTSSHLGLPDVIYEPPASIPLAPASLSQEDEPPRSEKPAIPSTLLEFFSLPDQTAIIVKQPDGSLHGAVADVGASALRDLVGQYRAALGLEGDRGVSAGVETLITPRPAASLTRLDSLAHELHDLLITPVAEHLPETPDESLVIVPHGPLWVLPFAALRDKDAYLGARYAIVHSSSEADWREGLVRKRPDPNTGRAWIVGNPKLPESFDACGTTYHFAPLPGAEHEARSIAALFGDDRSDLFLGSSADRLRLDAWHGAYAVIHLATHGVVCPDSPLDSFVLLSGLGDEDVKLDVGEALLSLQTDPRLPVTLQDFLSPPPASDPLAPDHTSGIPVPGDLPPLKLQPGGTDDASPQEAQRLDPPTPAGLPPTVRPPVAMLPGGILPSPYTVITGPPDAPLSGFRYPGALDARTLGGLYRLNADLVTLSACQTGLGRILGEGSIGLSRSLLAAGARSVLLSLWRVDDEATEHLMVAFYEKYLDHGNKALALQHAMKETQHAFPHPRYWAGFELLGAAE